MTIASEPLTLAERIHRFIDELRARGLPVSMTERVDAFRAVEGTRLDDTHGLHTALACTVVKSRDHLAVFDEVFRLYFLTGNPSVGLRSSEPAERNDGPGNRCEDVPASAESGQLHALDLDHAIRRILQDGSESLTRLVAEQAVAQYAGFEPGRRVAGVLYESRTVGRLRLDQIRGELLGALVGIRGSGGPNPSGGFGGVPQTTEAVAATGINGARTAANAPTMPRRGLPPLGVELTGQQISERAEKVRQAVREVIREILVADRGVDAVAATLRTPLPSDIAIAMASGAELAEIERVLRTLQVKLATSMMRKRRRHLGQLDVRATLRSSMATGGVPFRVHHRRPTPTRPKLFVLADVSGSVAAFATFTITLVSSMSNLFAQLRTFAFVENTVEITEVIDEIVTPADVIDAINGLPGLNFFDGHSNYGRSLRQFWERVGPQLGHRSTVLVFGDARGNYQPAEEEVFEHIARRAGAVYWLNPEGIGQWGSGDSLMDVYARHCTTVSLRTLNDLRMFIEQLD